MQIMCTLGEGRRARIQPVQMPRVRGIDDCMKNYKKSRVAEAGEGCMRWDLGEKGGQIMQSLKEHNLEFVFYSEEVETTRRV